MIFNPCYTCAFFFFLPSCTKSNNSPTTKHGKFVRWVILWVFGGLWEFWKTINSIISESSHITIINLWFHTSSVQLENRVGKWNYPICFCFLSTFGSCTMSPFAKINSDRLKYQRRLTMIPNDSSECGWPTVVPSQPSDLSTDRVLEGIVKQEEPPAQGITTGTLFVFVCGTVCVSLSIRACSCELAPFAWHPKWDVACLAVAVWKGAFKLGYRDPHRKKK